MKVFSNPFTPIYALLNTGTAQELYAKRPKFPLLIDVELTNHCNFSCRMCETGMNTSPRARGYMSEDIFHKLLKECIDHGTALRFIRWGEPTMHPSWLSFMLEAKKYKLPVHFNTNGSILSDDDFKAIIKGGIDVIKFSFQGFDKASYLEMRNTDYFDTLLERVAKLKELRGKSPTPLIQISTTILPPQHTNTAHTKAVEEFRLHALTIADYVNIGITIIDRINMDSLSEKQKTIQEKLYARKQLLNRPKACSEVFAKLSIDWDGTITSCCSDNRQIMSIGNLNNQTISEAWNNQIQARHQKILSTNDFDSLPLCKNCYEYMKL